MREYLFRGKTKETHEWVYGGIFVQDNRYFIIKSITYSCGQDSWGAFEVDPGSVGQYTGRVDKNNIKIFEGDILQGDEPGEFGLVFYYNTGFGIKYYGYLGSMMPYGWDETAGGFGVLDEYYLDEFATDELEIISNAFDDYARFRQAVPELF